MICMICMWTLEGGVCSIEYQPRGAGGTQSQHKTQYQLQNPKWPPGGCLKADGVLKRVHPLFWALQTNFATKLFDLSSHSRRKEEECQHSGAWGTHSPSVASHRNAWNTAPPAKSKYYQCSEPQIDWQDFERSLNLQSTFAKQVFDSSSPSKNTYKIKKARLPLVFGPSCQLLPIKFFYSSSSPMRKLNGKNNKNKKE